MLLPWVRKKLLADPHRLGRWGQKRAETFLKRKRCLRTIARNFAFSGGELDLVMADSNGVIVFVEVKTRRNEDFIAAVAAVNAKKRRHIARTAKCFLKQLKITNRPFRFDIVTVILGSGANPDIQHYPNAFVA
ncbi:MAG: YraN family protein [Planctomycetota bacterium]|jgi:putative endonuclease